jgi:Zn ribbon nucleic-acid-binding protein
LGIIYQQENNVRYKKPRRCCGLFDWCRKKNRIEETTNLLRKSGTDRGSGIRVGELEYKLQLIINKKYSITTPVKKIESKKGFIIEITIPQCNCKDFLQYLDENDIKADLPHTDVEPCIIYFQFIEALKLKNQLEHDNQQLNTIVPRGYGVQ